MKLRPEVAEVVTHLGEAAANWKGLMPPCVQVEIIASDSDPMSDLIEHGEFKTLIVPRCCQPSDGTGRISQPSSDIALEDPTILQTTSGSGPFNHLTHAQHN